jgi:tetratricopeptide (TPR) repeat protein
MTDPRPAPVRLRTQAEVDAAFAKATHPDTIARMAVPLLCQVLAVRPGRADAAQLLHGHLSALGDPDAAARAAEFVARAELDHPVLRRAQAAIEARRPEAATAELRAFVEEHPEDPVALRLIASAALQASQSQEAATFLRRALEIAPDYTDARRLLVDALLNHGQFAAALAELDRLIAADPATFEYRAVKAATLKRMRRTDEALALYDTLVTERPRSADLLVDQANALRAAGRGGDAADAYRRAVEAAPRSGRAWLSLADMKSVRLGEEDIAAMQDALVADDLPARERTALHFALGSALEGAGRHRDAFAQYAIANAFQRGAEPYDAAALTGHVARSEALVRATANPPEMQPAGTDTPIFVLGMPRSGSTLVEQVLAAHPAIEATEELPYLRAIANDLAGAGNYPQSLAKLPPDTLARVRARYLEQARAHRKGSGLFVDKAPANWQHLPLIAAAFPDARIIDARRDPLDCGFSNWTQRFGRGNEFAYGLGSIGHHIHHYQALMAAVDAAWPGRVHRVMHEALVADPEAEVRRLLDYVGVDFDPACLSPHANSAPAQSASSEQVRRPINAEGIGRHTPFDQWLGPLKQALGMQVA